MRDPTGGTKRKRGKWYRVRRAAQVAALLVFAFLLLETRQGMKAVIPHDLFFRLDPLLAVSGMLASRSWLPTMLLAGITFLLTLVLGRAWCGWLCPLGTLLDWTPSQRPNAKRLEVHPYWRQAKNLILFTIVLAAVLGNLTLIFLDPITVLVRTFGSVIVPLANLVVTGAQEWLYQIAPLRPALEWSDSLIRGTLLTTQPFYPPGLLIAALFAGILALNAIRARFWCRYLCPLGALLGLVSKISVAHHSVNGERCTRCYRCAVRCPTAAIKPERDFVADAGECTTCLNCVDVCPTGAISFGVPSVLNVHQPYEPSRRQLLLALGAAALGAAFLRLPVALGSAPTPLVRPPGASEEQLLSKCIRCGECARVCPTGVLQPNAANWEGLWTPRLLTRLGYCDYSCNACGQVCPTGAIPRLTLEEKRLAVIGKAVINERRCIPYAKGRDCVVCEEMCPIPQKAIVLEDKRVMNSLGQATTVRQPRVVRNLCTGCGVCEYRCPLNGEAAIQVGPHVEGGGGQRQGRGRGG